MAQRYEYEEIAVFIEDLAEWLSQGRTATSWSQIEGNPQQRTIADWLLRYPMLRDVITAAREIGADRIADDAMKILDTPDIREVVTYGPKGEVLSRRFEDALGHRKLQFWGRLKLLAVWQPRRYGDKVQVGGAADLPPVQLTNEQRLERIQQLIISSRQKRAEVTDGQQRAGGERPRLLPPADDRGDLPGESSGG